MAAQLIIGQQGPPGEDGTAGSQGVPGPPGYDGDDGPAGPPGNQGNTGAAGSTGATGATGSQGYIGPPGMDGEDGADSRMTSHAISGDIIVPAGTSVSVLRDSAAVSVIGRATNSVGVPADIAATVNFSVLNRTDTPNLVFTRLDNRSLLSGNDLLNSSQNGGFENGDFGYTKGVGWTIESDSTNARTGNFVAKCTDVSGVARGLNVANIAFAFPGDIVYAEAWIKTEVGMTMTFCRVSLGWYDKDGVFISSANGNNFSTDQTTYVKSFTTATAPANSVYYKLFVFVTKTVGNVWVDDFYTVRKVNSDQLLLASSFSAHKNTSAQNFTTATSTKVTFGTEEFDTSSNFASSTFTAPVDGKYTFRCAARVTAVGVGTTNMRLHLYKNGALYKTLQHVIALAGLTDLTLQGSVIASAVATDTFEIYMEFVGLSSGTATIGGAVADTYFSGIKW